MNLVRRFLPPFARRGFAFGDKWCRSCAFWTIHDTAQHQELRALVQRLTNGGAA